ncbi:MAG: type II toxin-antitoxin system VapC family toxin [Gammaproteobacteria bacterium]|nr:type II toxin-antitoxin system VapC family toxin [Gammaproteobacteria bacterium]
MRAIDTNVVVRFLTGDDPGQAARARAVVDAGDIFISTTVLLESEWVLRGVYGFARADVVTALRAFLGLPGISVDKPDLIAEALDRTGQGMDFADALHLGAASQCKEMLTFDRQFIVSANDARIRVAEP